ncbi:T9SS type A sorting domain-containing protein [Marinirhabdus gelatinilytica]|uniref:T9SS type A sorting domain-containing protein n=1 Tax=Marinirhabdus gelatinilytica TaxID=1703343 RepID=UPI0014765FB8|nr:T9SS type A sorting domain-containing protein [Marinirhabdus gelatinilytica]
MSIIIADLDGDGFLDALTGARSSNEVAWFKNEDGLGTFGSVNPITPSDEVRRIHAGDLDGDGDNDIVVAQIFEDTFYWQENLDGEGNFGPQQIIDDNADNAYEAIPADLDGDGDLDLVAAISDDSRAVWYENLDGQGNFGSLRVISNVQLACRSVFPADIDGDGDLDVVANSGGDVTISWFENEDGLGNFGPKKIVAGEALYVADVFCADMDGDGDLDIVGTTNAEDRVAWHENLDGLGAFGPQQIITNEALSCTSIFCGDLDNDGDIDVLYSSTPNSTIENSQIAWSENLDGQGTFGGKLIIGDELQLTREVYAADIDSDGDLDVFAASQNNNKVVWYENQTILGVGEQRVQGGVTLYPNPTQTELFIEHASYTTFNNVTIYSVQGKIVLQQDYHSKAIDISQLSSGVYFVSLTDTQAKKTVRKFIKK